MTPSHNPEHVAHMANSMSQHCKNEKLAMTLQYVAIGSMVCMALASAVHLVKDLFGSHDNGHKR